MVSVTVRAGEGKILNVLGMPLRFLCDAEDTDGALVVSGGGDSIEVLFVGQPDSMTPLRTKGVGELAITAMAAAIANTVNHATGTRVRSLPISIEKVLVSDR